MCRVSQKKSLIVPLSESLTEQAVDMTFHHNLAFADSVIYASSFSHGVTLYTLNNYFRIFLMLRFFL